MRYVHHAVLTTALACAAAQAEVATFDDLQEGFTPTTFTSGGITFSHGLWFPDSVDLTFGIDNASGDFPFKGYGSIYSAPNIMTVGGYVTGPGTGYFRVHSWQATADMQVRNFARLDLFHVVDFPETTVALEAFMNDELVATDSFMITESMPGVSDHRVLSISGVEFNRIRFIATGGIFPGDANGILGVFDNVEMSLIPSPAALAMLLAGAAMTRRRRA